MSPPAPAVLEIVLRRCPWCGTMQNDRRRHNCRQCGAPVLRTRPGGDRDRIRRSQRHHRCRACRRTILPGFWYLDQLTAAPDRHVRTCLQQTCLEGVESEALGPHPAVLAHYRECNRRRWLRVRRFAPPDVTPGDTPWQEAG